MKQKLSGKTALVLGGARGIGKAVAGALHRDGARVVLCDKNPKDLIAAAKEIGEIICYPVDPRGKLGPILRRIGRVDVWIDATGTGKKKGR